MHDIVIRGTIDAPARMPFPATWRSQATASSASAASRVPLGDTTPATWSRRAGSTCIRITMARRCGTRCSRRRAGMASPR